MKNVIAIVNALTDVRFQNKLSNKELFTNLFNIVPKFTDSERDGRTKLAKEQQEAIDAFNVAANNLVRFMK